MSFFPCGICSLIGAVTFKALIPQGEISSPNVIYISLLKQAAFSGLKIEYVT